MLKKTALVLLPVVIFMVLFTSSCEKPIAPEAKVTVVDTTGSPVQGALVRIYCSEASCDLDTETEGEQSSVEDETNISGNVYMKFEFPALLQVEASKGTLSGSDVIKLQEGENGDNVTELTIEIK